MAVEDAVALALLLKGATRTNLEQRIQAFQTIRRPRTTRMLEMSIASALCRFPAGSATDATRPQWARSRRARR
jgi:2-polyprenyl-6-methoxyphenol hydroxylase-like FAD-dependent oxidoreductase